MSVVLAGSGVSGKMSHLDALLLQLVRRQLMVSGVPSGEWEEREATLLVFSKQLLGSAMKASLQGADQIADRIKKRALRHHEMPVVARLAEKLASLQLGNKAAVLYFLLRLSERESLPLQTTQFTPIPTLKTIPSMASLAQVEPIAAPLEADPLLMRGLLGELLFVLRGMDTPNFKLLSSGQFVLNQQLNVARPQRMLLEKLAQTGFDYRSLEVFCQQRSLNGGVVATALRAAVQGELYRLVHPHLMQFEARLDTLPTPLAATAFFRPLCRQVQALRAMVELVANLPAHLCLNELHRLRSHGDAAVASLASNLTAAVSVPYFEKLSIWMEKGELHDPHRELFMEVLAGEHADAWRLQFKFHRELVPTGLISEAQAERILLCGKMVHFLTAFRVEMSSHFAPLTEKDLSQTIEQRYVDLAKAMKHLFMQEHSLSLYLTLIRDFMLLGRADFSTALVDGMSEALNKPAASILRHNVLGVLEGCVRETMGMGMGDQEAIFLNAIDVRLLEAKPGQFGWDIFGLDCRIPAPLDTLLTAEVMREFQRMGQFLWHLKRVEYAATTARRRLLQSKALDAGDLRIDFRRHQLLQHEVLCVASKLVSWAFQAIREGWSQLDRELEAATDLDAMSKALWSFLTQSKANLVLWSNQALKGRLATLLSTILRSERTTLQLISMAATSNIPLKQLTEQRAQLQTMARQFQADLDELLLQLRKEATVGADGQEAVRSSYRHLELELDFASYHARRTTGFDQAKYAGTIRSK